MCSITPTTSGTNNAAGVSTITTSNRWRTSCRKAVSAGSSYNKSLRSFTVPAAVNQSEGTRVSCSTPSRLQPPASKSLSPRLSVRCSIPLSLGAKKSISTSSTRNFLWAIARASSRLISDLPSCRTELHTANTLLSLYFMACLRFTTTLLRSLQPAYPPAAGSFSPRSPKASGFRCPNDPSTGHV